VTSVYHQQSGIRVYEREGLLVFDVPEPVESGADVEIFARSGSAAIQEASLDVLLLTREVAKGGGGATGLIANLGKEGPTIGLNAGPGSAGAGIDISYCPSDGAAYDACRHPDPCDSLEIQTGRIVRLRILRTTSGIDTYVDGDYCGRYSTDQHITSLNLNMYVETGSAFRMGVDNFYMRYVAP
jgi:hypothetical protein